MIQTVIYVVFVLCALWFVAPYVIKWYQSRNASDETSVLHQQLDALLLLHKSASDEAKKDIQALVTKVFKL